MPHATAEPQVQFSYEDFVKLHRVQLESAAVPERYWHKLHDKLKDEVFDAGSVFGLMRVEHVDEDGEETGKYSWKAAVTDDEGVDYLDEKHIYLIDHAWSYSADKARAQLRVVPGLAERMAGIMDLKTEGKTKEEIVEEIFNEMWKYNQTYSFANAPKGSEESFAVWYIMDEFGSRIQHSYEPSCRLVPFFYVPMQLTFSILFPVKNLEEGEEITRDYAENTDDPLVKKAKLLPWVPADMTYIGHQQEEPGEEYFEKYRREEPLPNLDKTFPPLPGDRRIKVFTDEQYLQQYLTSDRFELVNNAKDADILWLMEHFFDHKEFSEEMPEKFINQFPHEAVLTVKDLMPIVARRVSSATEQQDELESQPYWLSQTYNLSTELPQFASLFQKRESKGLDNHWICKPYNLSRGLDIHITSNLNYIIKLSDSGPKVACKYLDDTVLFHRPEIGGVKFDLRWFVMLCGVQPLKLCVCKTFYPRFPCKPFSLDDLDDFEKHFTSMTYVSPQNVVEVYRSDFISRLEEQYPGHHWEDVEKKILKALQELFTAAYSAPPPRGIAPSPQSRAIYGIDIMLKWRTDQNGERYMQPIILEVNFTPDCSRVCKHYPDFYNDMFAVAFLDDDVIGKPLVVLTS